MPIVWNSDLDTGIDIIDEQHRQIAEFINRLEGMRAPADVRRIQEIFDGCLDYTRSHFACEESLLEEAGYPYCKAHKRVHELFVRRLTGMQAEMASGKDIRSDLHQLLSRWLVSHIRGDDANFVPAVKTKMIAVIKEKEEKRDAGWLQRFFKQP